MSTTTDTPPNSANEGEAMTTDTAVDMTEFEAEILRQETVMLPASERCDFCGAQAYVEVEMRSGSKLSFCSHDYHRHQEKLRTTAKRIFDYTFFLTKRPENVNGV